MTSPLPIERLTGADCAGVCVIRLEQPGRPVITLDRALVERLDATLDAVPRNAAGIVLASASDRVFVAGADLHEIHSLSDADLDAYLSLGQRVFGRLAMRACHVVAAVNGAALGGGLEIALHCDSLVALRPPAGGKPYTVGLPEAGLHICPGWGGTNLLPARIDARRAIEMTATGRTMTAPEAIDARLFADVAEAPGDLIDRAARLAATPKPVRLNRTEPLHIGQVEAGCLRPALAAARAALPGSPSARAVCACVETGLTRGWLAALDAERRSLIELRNAPAGREAIEAFLSRSTVKK